MKERKEKELDKLRKSLDMAQRSGCKMASEYIQGLIDEIEQPDTLNCCRDCDGSHCKCLDE